MTNTKNKQKTTDLEQMQHSNHVFFSFRKLNSHWFVQLVHRKLMTAIQYLKMHDINCLLFKWQIRYDFWASLEQHELEETEHELGTANHAVNLVEIE